MSISGLAHWLDTPQGQYILQWEQQKADQVVADIFGYNALQLGLPQRNFLRASRIPLCQRLAHEGPVDAACELTELPIASSSVDLVVLPHVLEFYPDPHQILREIERILIPEGQLVILGFNPYSLWGLHRHMPWREEGFPWEGHYLSVARLKDWLQLLGMELDRGAFGCYSPAFVQEKWLQRAQFMELAGDRWWGFAGGVYLVRAIKRVRGMRLLTPAWRSARTRKSKAFIPISPKEKIDV